MVDFNPTRGSEQGGNRPAVIVSNDINNQHSPVVVVAAMTTNEAAGRYPQNVLIPDGGPLGRAGVILGGQLLTISKERLGDRRTELSPELVQQLNFALRVSLGI